jgi:L-amino acid N-acyltransferase YncA
VRVRRAVASDAHAIARVSVDTWRSTYRDMVPDEHLAALTCEDRAAEIRRTLADRTPSRCCFVTEDENCRVFGFAWGGPRREGSERFAGELCAIYVLAGRDHAGAGSALEGAVADDLLARGMRSMLVWVLAQNPSRGFYEALGGRLIEEREIGGATLGTRMPA